MLLACILTSLLAVGSLSAPQNPITLTPITISETSSKGGFPGWPPSTSDPPEETSMTTTTPSLSTVVPHTTPPSTPSILMSSTSVTSKSAPQPPANCPTATITGTACKNCLVPQFTAKETLTKECGCPAVIPTSTVNLFCDDPGVCNNIGCKTVYQTVTQNCV